MLIGLFFGAAWLVGLGAITMVWGALDSASPSVWWGALMLLGAVGCGWGIWRLARR